MTDNISICIHDISIIHSHQLDKHENYQIINKNCSTQNDEYKCMNTLAYIQMYTTCLYIIGNRLQTTQQEHPHTIHH